MASVAFGQTRQPPPSRLRERTLRDAPAPRYQWPRRLESTAPVASFRPSAFRPPPTRRIGLVAPEKMVIEDPACVLPRDYASDWVPLHADVDVAPQLSLRQTAVAAQP